MAMMHSTAAAAFWSIAVLVLWIAAVGGAAWAAVRMTRQPRRRPPTLPSPLDILERRFAAGEMTHDEFDEARARLREHELDV
ncbi:SHOCT domain-containing protein [Kribbella sindirgiensis]|uniref:SHOCT domain-containing protein n=1 Tax=Kribbella sindirgiensis TaxID=1124744 RepID=A0A4R0HXJ3_9ACTN|nr:SHOCT domain-containing protein [Kribbella sindirgiensis]TCC16078.1 SHOCT domain-containing protein [Kribbella sindirgiensis]